MEKLLDILDAIDKKNYPDYKKLKGTYEFEGFKLHIQHVQGDPFAKPSRIAIQIPNTALPVPESVWKNPAQRTGLEDAIWRDWFLILMKAPLKKASGKSGLWGCAHPGQEMLKQTASEISDESLTLKFTIGLPGDGRRIRADHAEEMLCNQLPAFVHRLIHKANLSRWKAHALSYEDQEHLRHLLSETQQMAFIADGSILPRASGVDQLPLKDSPVPWVSPAELKKTVELPNAGKVTGTLIPNGVTLICGGGYHGKSTLLQALTRGVYNHIPGDGRELCVSNYESVAIRAEDGRAVHRCNISPFISKLPNGKQTLDFSSENASGSTSQAANIVEAIELGAKCLLIDEDTSATNFMTRDQRMQRLIQSEDEPITPFLDRVRELYEDFGVSTILVIGGTGDYFEAADTVIIMKDYLATLGTEAAKAIAKELPSQRANEKVDKMHLETKRSIDPRSLNPSSGTKAEKVHSRRRVELSFGKSEIDLSAVSQLIEQGQTKTIGQWMVDLSRRESAEGLAEFCKEMETRALGVPLSSTMDAQGGEFLFTRRFELASALNRFRELKFNR